MHTYVVLAKPGEDGHRATVYVVTAANKREARRLVSRGGKRFDVMFIERASGLRGSRRLWSVD